MSWTRVETKGAAPEPRHSASVICRGEQLVVFGGTGPREAYNSVHVLDTPSWTWTRAACTGLTPPARWGHSAHLWGADTMVVFGGADVDHGPLLDVRLLDLRSLEWTRPTAVSGATPPPRSYHSAALVGDTLYVLGGDTPAKTDATLYTFDLRSSTWDAAQRGIPVLPAKKQAMAATPDGARLVVVGGVALSNLQILGDVHVFDIAARRWSEGRSSGATPGPRAGHVVACAGEKLVLFGGQAGKGSFPTETHEMNLETLSWFKRRGTGAVPPPRTMACACTMPDRRRMFVYGGLSAADERTPLGDAFVYNPAATAF